MVQLAFTVLAFAALIAIVFGRQEAQNFLTACVFRACLGLFAFLLYKIDQIGRPAPRTAPAPTPKAAPVATSAVTKRIYCFSCDGAGRDQCLSCLGTGREPLSEHDIIGTGPKDESGFSGPPIFRNQPLPCPSCNGSGFVRCNVCYGVGIVTVDAAQYPNAPAIGGR